VSLMGRLHSESGKRCRDKLAKECRLFSNGWARTSEYYASYQPIFQEYLYT
jgi:hypothetical protein